MSSTDEVFDYVMNSPENTNPAVLRSLLDNLPTGSSESNDFIITFSGLYGDETASCDKTFEEIKEAFAAGKQIKSYYRIDSESDDESGYVLYELQTCVKVWDSELSEVTGSYVETANNAGLTNKTSINCIISDQEIRCYENSALS